MRVGVLVVCRSRKQRARFAQVGADRAIRCVELGVDDAHAALIRSAQPLPVVAVAAVVHHREDGVDAVRLAKVEVVLAVVGRHVDEAGAAIGGDEVAGEQRARRSVEPAQCVHRMAGEGSGEVCAFDYPVVLDALAVDHPAAKRREAHAC